MIVFVISVVKHISRCFLLLVSNIPIVVVGVANSVVVVLVVVAVVVADAVAAVISAAGSIACRWQYALLLKLPLRLLLLMCLVSVQNILRRYNSCSR